MPDALAVYHSSANAFTDPCPDPDSCGKPHTHADVVPDPPAIRHIVAIPDDVSGRDEPRERDRQRD